jgi:hypothetical protein
MITELVEWVMSIVTGVRQAKERHYKAQEGAIVAQIR